VTELNFTRTIPATPERVWRAWTTDTELAGWMWPAAWNSEAEVDLRIGGRYRLHSDVHGRGLSGEFVALEPPTRLVQTFKWDEDDYETLVTVTFAPDGSGGTELTILHERFTSQDEADQHLQGWDDCVDRLVTYARG
jgi:uncharacterized protein YndB with AHSA1/START domain